MKKNYSELFSIFSTGPFSKSFVNEHVRGCPIVYSLWRAQPVQKEQAMSDNLRRYRAIRDALTQCYPGQPSGTVARHLITLAALISGIVGSKSTQLPHIATKVPNGTKPESRVKRFARWLDNAHILEEVYFLPYADVLLCHLALQTVVLVMDGSGVGRGGTALMIHVIYKGRALPLAWRVRQAPKGIKSRCIWSAIWPQQRRPVAGMKSDSASRPFSQTRKVEASIFISRIYPMFNVCHGY